MYIELSDKQREAIQDYLPSINMNGRPHGEDRSVIKGILYVLGCQWSAMPKSMGFIIPPAGGVLSESTVE